MAIENNKILKDHVVLAEGVDAQFFLIHLLNILKFNNIQVFDFHGVCDLPKYLKLFRNLPGYNKIQSIIIARDAEKSASSAVQSVNGSLQSNDLIEAVIEPFEVSYGQMNIGIILFPGFDDTGKLCNEGTLEDLCIKLFKFQEIVPYADTCIKDFQEKHSVKFKRPHKNKLHAMLSLTDDYAGMKIGETADARGFNLESSYLRPYIDILEKINCLGSVQ
jgi:hypothetical protein